MYQNSWNVTSGRKEAQDAVVNGCRSNAARAAGAEANILIFVGLVVAVLALVYIVSQNPEIVSAIVTALGK
jgi:hypothetical protein